METKALFCCTICLLLIDVAIAQWSSSGNVPQLEECQCKSCTDEGYCLTNIDGKLETYLTNYTGGKNIQLHIDQMDLEMCRIINEGSRDTDNSASGGDNRETEECLAVVLQHGILGHNCLVRGQWKSSFQGGNIVVGRAVVKREHSTFTTVSNVKLFNTKQKLKHSNYSELYDEGMYWNACNGILVTKISQRQAQITFYVNEDGDDGDCDRSFQWRVNITEQKATMWSKADSFENILFNYKNTIQSDSCEEKCVHMAFTRCSYNERFCANEIKSTVKAHAKYADGMSYDVIHFTDSITIRQQCKNSYDAFTPSPATRGIGLTKIQRKSDRIRFQFIAFASANNVRELKFQYEGNLSEFLKDDNDLRFQCKSDVRSSERWNSTIPTIMPPINSPACSANGTSVPTMLDAIAGLFRQSLSSWNNANIELEFYDNPDALVQRSSFRVEKGDIIKWKMKRETIVTTPSAIRCRPPETQTQTTEDDDDAEHDMLKEERLKSEECKITGTHLAITVILSFLAGAIVMFLLLLLLRYLRNTEKCSCFGKEDGIGEGQKAKKGNTAPMRGFENYHSPPEKVLSVNGKPIVNSVTQPTYSDQKIYSKLSSGQDENEHVYDQSQTAYEALNTKGNEKSGMRSDEHVYNTAENTYQSLTGQATMDNKQADTEHVYSGLADNNEAKHVIAADAPRAAANNATDKLDDLFENRESAVSEHNYFALENENYRSINKVDEPGTAAPSQEDPGTYFVLENESKAEEEDPKTDGQTENNYFVLEKDSSVAQTDDGSHTEENNADGNTYFVLEKPVQ